MVLPLAAKYPFPMLNVALAAIPAAVSVEAAPIVAPTTTSAIVLGVVPGKYTSPGSVSYTHLTLATIYSV